MAKAAVRCLVIAAWLVATTAHAQTPMQKETTASTTLNLTLEQRHVIRELIKDLKIEPSAATPATIGQVISPQATVRPVPGSVGEKVPQIKAHQFVYTAQSILSSIPRTTPWQTSSNSTDGFAASAWRQFLSIAAGTANAAMS